MKQNQVFRHLYPTRFNYSEIMEEDLIDEATQDQGEIHVNIQESADAPDEIVEQFKTSEKVVLLKHPDGTISKINFVGVPEEKNFRDVVRNYTRRIGCRGRIEELPDGQLLVHINRDPKKVPVTFLKDDDKGYFREVTLPVPQPKQ